MKNKCADIVEFMEELAPVSLAESWDNAGLLAGTLDADINRILLALDVTAETVEEAIEQKTEMIISHHPFIFKGLKSITEDDPKGRLACMLIRHGITVYCAHTNLDVAAGGVNDVLAQRLGLTGIANFKDYDKFDADGFQPGLGKVGLLKEKTVLGDFVNMLKSVLEAANVRTVGKAEVPVSKVAVFCGSFDDDLDAFKQSGADVLVTGDLKYHMALDILQMDRTAVDAGHFNTERVILPVLAGKLKNRFPYIEVLTSTKEKDPFSTY